MDDGAGGGKSLRMIVQAKTCEFSNTELLAKNALTVVALESPILEEGLDATGAFEERGFCGFEELLRAGKQGFARAEKLKLIADSFLGAWAGELCGLEFPRGKIDKSEANG